MMLSVLTERRVHSPPGLAGGSPGERGRNTLKRADGRKINLGPKTAVPVCPAVSGSRVTQSLLTAQYHPPSEAQI